MATATRKPTAEEIFSGKYKANEDIPVAVRPTVPGVERALTAEEQFAEMERAAAKANKQVRRAANTKDEPAPAPEATPDETPAESAPEAPADPSTDPATDQAPTE